MTHVCAEHLSRHSTRFESVWQFPGLLLFSEVIVLFHSIFKSSVPLEARHLSNCLEMVAHLHQWCGAFCRRTAPTFVRTVVEAREAFLDVRVHYLPGELERVASHGVHQHEELKVKVLDFVGRLDDALAFEHFEDVTLTNASLTCSYTSSPFLSIMS